VSQVADLNRSAPDSDRGPGCGVDGRLHRRRSAEALEGVEPFQKVLTMRARVDEADTSAFVRRALQEIRAHINDRNVEVVGPPFSLCHPLTKQIVDVEAGWPVRSARGTDRIHAGALPATQLGRHGRRIRGPGISLSGPLAEGSSPDRHRERHHHPRGGCGARWGQ
jgi:hypothetical protein